MLRFFKDKNHYYSIIREILNIDMSFIRMGSSGDPSEDWCHTIFICKEISKGIRETQLNIWGSVKEEKQIVIITKHWNALTDDQLLEIANMNICINTSISVLDGDELINHRIDQYLKLKNYCKSVLRIVSFDFNLDNEIGFELSSIQESLFNQHEMIDTVFRTSKNNYLVKSGIINTHKTKFLGKKSLISKRNKKTYFGSCPSCLEQCGLNFKK